MGEGKKVFSPGHMNFEMLFRHLHRDAEKASEYKNSGLCMSFSLLALMGLYVPAILNNINFF